MTKAGIESGFVAGPRGALFTIVRQPASGPAPAVLIVPPFADEMNKSRKMLTDVAQALAQRGLATVHADLYGTGDSAGEFRDGDWDGWIEDLVTIAAWSATQGRPVTGLLGVRLGCLLAAQLADRLPEAVERTVFWQPVIDGQRFMTQFLRLRVAASLMEDRRESVAGLREQVLAGATIEVAGYEVSSRLLHKIDQARMTDVVTASIGHLGWLELVREAGEDMPGSSLACIEALRGALPSVATGTAVGEPFWGATEIVRIPALVEQTVEMLAHNA